jgi:hypothetical protein
MIKKALHPFFLPAFAPFAETFRMNPINGRSPYRIYSQWQNPQTREVHVFKSECISFDPTEYVKGEAIEVLIDPKTPSAISWIYLFYPKKPRNTKRPFAESTDFPV